jgi:molybdopterin/thiamine biosynthesis adenylyltransferase
MADPITIQLPDDSDRFARLRQIAWWDQSRLASARVLVIGAGALGNEIIKNLALLGVGNLLIADRDVIEHSNLSRSVLYREGDIGLPKSEVAAMSAREIFPGMNVHHFHGDVIAGLGAGAYRWADIVIGGLDNREARLHINRTALRLSKPWIDGAIEQIQGVARVFTPEASQPCYECTMSSRDWQLIQQRRSCNMLTRSQLLTGHTPTTPTISSIIAGVQTQEAVKLLHQLPTLAGRGFVFMGDTCEAYHVEYQRKAECMSHERYESVVSLDAGTDSISLRAFVDEARQHLGPGATIDLGRDIVRQFSCPTCGKSESVFAPLSHLKTDSALCPCDNTTVRALDLFHTLRGDEDFLDRPARSIGIPPFDILTARSGDRLIGLELSADAATVLGDLPAESLQWL